MTNPSRGLASGEPSRTAFGAATHRAVHQDLEDGRIFRDPLAWPILGLDDATRAEVLAQARERRPYLRLFIAVRHRVAEDTIAAAHARGVRQAVVLGAGLDTFAYRNPHPDLAVLEVDHPATGRWKQDRVAAAGIPVPRTVRYLGCDFEHEDFVERLTVAGFDVGRPSVFAWLGVTPYLTAETVRRTLDSIASLSAAEVVFDHTGPAEGLSGEAAELRARLAARVASAGEPFRSEFTREQMATMLAGSGFDDVEQIGRNEILRRWFGIESDAPGGGHVVRARVSAGG
jgi:methyltransferase (TIGR00027 family)